MNKERLIIKNFGPIQEIDLELNKMTVLIGENATGKSTIGKTLAMCRYFSYFVEGSNSSFPSRFVNFGLNDWGISSFLKDDSYIEYENGDYRVSIEWIEEELVSRDSEDGNPSFNSIRLFKPNVLGKSKRFQNLIKDFSAITIKNSEDDNYFDEFPYEFLKNRVKPILNNPFFVPAERSLQSIFSLGRGTIQNMSDSLFDQFAQLDQKIKSFVEEIEIEPLNIYYVNRNGKGLIRKKNEESLYSLSNSATGYQSAIPIILVEKYYAQKEKRLGRIYIIEEPEINLFPTNQRNLVNFFTKSINQHKNQFILPTHSPYILSALNNCLYAYSIGNKNQGKYKESVAKIKSENEWLSPEDISVYYLEKGKAIDIFDKEENLINTDYIDSVSREINKEFDELLTIEMQDE